MMRTGIRGQDFLSFPKAPFSCLHANPVSVTQAWERVSRLKEAKMCHVADAQALVVQYGFYYLFAGEGRASSQERATAGLH